MGILPDPDISSWMYLPITIADYMAAQVSSYLKVSRL